MNKASKRILIVGGVLLALSLVVLVIVLSALVPRVHQEIEGYLEKRTGRRVEVGSLHWSVWPRIQLRGEGIQVASEQGVSSGPLLRVDSFTVEAGFLGLLEKPRQIRSLRFEGLQLFIPPRQEKEQPPKVPEQSAPAESPVSIGQIVATDARIEIASSRPEKKARVFELQELTLSSVSLDTPIPFEAHLTYPRPEGQLSVSGAFGPWNRPAPSETPLSGTFSFKDADLGTFRGIEGLLTTEGTFEGDLQETEVSGEADIPDFSVTKVGTKVSLHSVFETRRVGGDVFLRSVHTSFNDSTLVATGEITGSPDGEGKVVNLHVRSDPARIEDLLQFAVQAEKPPLTGDIDLDTTVFIPPGTNPFIERFRVEGEFRISEGQFTNVDIQKTLEKISRVGGGESSGEGGSSTVSDLNGGFVLENSVLDFSKLTFSVPGTAVELTGRYGLEDQTLDFRGNILLSRSPSDMVSGKLGQWIKVIDPLLKGGKAGTRVPIKIAGTRSKPSFSLDVKGLKSQWKF